MIIIKYLIRETLKNQIVILFILLLVFFCQKLVKILGAITDGKIPINFIFNLLGLGVPEMMKIILPLSLFLAISITFGRFYTENEITAMYACCIKIDVLLKATIILIFFTSIVAAFNVMWLAPLSLRYQYIMMQGFKKNPVFTPIASNQFQMFNNANIVIFVEKVQGNKLNRIFLVQFKNKKNVIHPISSIVLANKGHMEQQLNNTQIIKLHKGISLKGTALQHNFSITNFINYQARIKCKKVTFDLDSAEQAYINTLFSNKLLKFKIELHWRLTLIVSVLVIALMVVPLSIQNSRYDHVLSIIPVILIYLIFFLLQSAIKSNAIKGKFDPTICIWTINIFYLLIAIILNIWNTAPIIYLRRFIKYT